MHSTESLRPKLAAVLAACALAALAPSASAALPRAAATTGYDELAPVSKRLDIVCTGGYGSSTFAVPAGQRLVIDYVSADVGVPVGGTALFSIATYLDGSEVESHLPMSSNGTLLGQSVYTISQQTRIYADASTVVTVALVASTANCGTVTGIYGHYIPLP